MSNNYIMLIISALGSIFYAVAGIPQIILFIRTRSSKGFSVLCALCFICGGMSFFIYSIYLNNIAMALCNVVTLSTGVMALVFRRWGGGK